ncbi:MAG: tetratricopeptide repeat protein [Candidatus Omnitrophota bacterium]
MLRSAWIYPLLLVLVTIGVYANSLGGDFVYDDKAMIVAYDLVKDIGNIPKAFTSATTLYGNVNYYRPVQTVSYMADYFLWGKEPLGFHLTNVIFHVACVLLVYVFINLLFKNRILGLVTALLFSVHPAHTGVVSYIAGRADSILCVFMLACFIFYVKYRYTSGTKLDYIFSLLFFILTLLTKEFAMIIPVAVILFDRCATPRTSLPERRQVSPGYVPFFLILAVYVLFRVKWMGFFVEGVVPPFPLKNRIISAPYFFAQYLRLIVMPNDLHMGRAPWVAGTILDVKVIASILAIAAVGYAAYRAGKRSGAIYFGAWWFVLMIVPSLNIIAASYYTFAENWLYMPSIGLFLIIAAASRVIYEKLTVSRFPATKYAVVAVIGFFIFTMGAITVVNNNTWKDEIALGTNTLRFNPEDFKIYNNMGVSYLAKGDLDKAERSFRKCLEIKPDTGMAYFNLYRVYMARGRRKQAAQYLNKARELDPARVEILVEKMGIRD